LKFEADEDTERFSSQGIFEGQVWCVTGSFDRFKPRSLAVGEIEKRGGRIVTSVTGKTTHLLAGKSAGSKLARAVEMGIPVVTGRGNLRPCLQGRGRGR